MRMVIERSGGRGGGGGGGGGGNTPDLGERCCQFEVGLSVMGRQRYKPVQSYAFYLYS